MLRLLLPAAPPPTGGFALRPLPSISAPPGCATAGRGPSWPPGPVITMSEWEEIEAGRVPDTWEHVLLLVAALGIDRSWLPYFARLCEGAQEQSTAAGPESLADSGEGYS